MRRSTWWVLPVIPCFLLLTACPADDPDPAVEDPDTVVWDDEVDVGEEERVGLSEIDDSGVSGEAHLTAMMQRTEVLVEVEGAEPETSLSVALHEGDCDMPGAEVGAPGTVTVDADGRGATTYSVDHPLDHLREGEYVVQVLHEGTVVACGEIRAGLF